nr:MULTISPECIES: type II toxin-antitoxin system prevent-host-death family antitoxin [unclassified Frankia]
MTGDGVEGHRGAGGAEMAQRGEGLSAGPFGATAGGGEVPLAPSVVPYLVQHWPGGGSGDGMVAAISASEARKTLFPLIEQVNADHTPVEIVSKRGNAVLVSKEDWDSIVETNYLLRTPVNARRLMESVEQWHSGEAVERPLSPDE